MSSGRIVQIIGAVIDVELIRTMFLRFTMRCLWAPVSTLEVQQQWVTALSVPSPWACLMAYRAA